jgi:hypothetical protein
VARTTHGLPALRRRAGLPLAAAALGALSVLLAGCSELSPDTIATPYAPGDGVSANLTNPADGSYVGLRNFLIVAASEGDAGRVVGSVVNTGTTPVQLSLAADQGASTAPVVVRVDVPALGVTQVGSDEGTQMLLGATPGAGRMMPIRAATTSGGAVDLTVPVLAPVGFYATLAPPPPTPALGVTATPVPSGPEGSATPAPSATTSP